MFEANRRIALQTFCSGLWIARRHAIIRAEPDSGLRD
jgi:hypothetical protein